MLVRTLFVLLLFSVLAETIVHGAHALAGAVLRREASVAVHVAMDEATAAARNALASAIAAGADPRSVAPAAPSPAPTCALAAPAGCRLEASSTISFTSEPAATPLPCVSDGCTIYEQGNDAVTEGRVVATIGAQVVTAGGVVLASRSQRVAFRTWRIAPYAAVVGEVDGSEALAPSGQGDDGGAAPNGAAPGTLIDVIYENRVTGARMPANVWQPDVEKQPAQPQAWSP